MSQRPTKGSGFVSSPNRNMEKEKAESLKAEWLGWRDRGNGSRKTPWAEGGRADTANTDFPHAPAEAARLLVP